MSEGTARYAKDDGTWILKLEGDVRHPLSPAVNDLLDRAFADPDLRHFVIDLSQAELIDSTNLGVLARIANQMAEEDLPRPVVIAPGADIQTLLRAVCFDNIFRVITEPADTHTALQDLPALEAEERETLALVLDAHRRLCAVDEGNRAAFRDVVEALGRELGSS
jgi:anti-anti-sigma factor